jgi:hypothetical protein
MQNALAGAIGGLTGGLLLSGTMALGRSTGLLHETLAERSEDWLDQMLGARHYLGAQEVTLIEQTNHLLASAVFGASYGAARSYFHPSPMLAGSLYGGFLYAVNIIGIAPRIRLTRGESHEPSGVVGQRLAMHVLFGIATAMVTEALIDRPA